MIDSVVKNMYIFILLMKSCSSIFALLSVPASTVEALCLEFHDYSSTNIPNCIEGLLKVNYLLLITSQSAGYEFFNIRIKFCAFKFETVLVCFWVSFLRPLYLQHRFIVYCKISGGSLFTSVNLFCCYDFCCLISRPSPTSIEHSELNI